MRNLFAFRGYIVERAGNIVTIRDRSGAELSAHGIGATTITGTAGPLTLSERREVREIIAALDQATE
jgi:hypothetical protein